MVSNNVIDEKFLEKLETYALYVRSDMQGYFGGNHQTKSYGSTVEFADFREYNLGDDIRRIDWNLFSRFEKYFIKLFIDERQMHIQIFLDCSASMQKPDGGKALYAMRAAAAVAFLSVQNMDRTSLRLIKDEFADDLCGVISGKNAFYHGITALNNVEFKGEADLEKAIVSCPGVGSDNGLTVIISDFLTESNWKKAVDYLLFQKRQVLLLQVLSPEDVNPVFNGRMRLLDIEAEDPADERHLKMKITKSHLKAYEQALEDFRKDIKSFCSARGAGYVCAVSNEPIEKLLFERLNELGVVK